MYISLVGNIWHTYFNCYVIDFCLIETYKGSNLFEKVVLRRAESGSAITLGDIAEAALFYQNVHLVLDYCTLNGLVKNIGMPDLLSFLSRPNISAVYCEETLGTKTEKHGSTETHQFIAFMLAGDQEVGQLNSRKKRLEYIIERQGYTKKQARRFAEKFRNIVPIKKVSDDYFVEGGVVSSAWNDVTNHDFVHEAIRCVLEKELGCKLINPDFFFRVLPSNPTFQIRTNLDFDSINSFRKEKGISQELISPANFINNLLEARADTVFSSHYGGEFYASEITSSIIRIKHNELLKRAGINSAELKNFNEIVLDGVPSIKEIINSGSRDFSEFLKLLDKSQKFRDWTQGVNPDEKLVKAYFRDVTAEGLGGKVPVKVLRYVLGSVVSAVEPVTGTVASAADNFLTEKILGGWRPSHFIERKLKPFLDK